MRAGPAVSAAAARRVHLGLPVPAGRATGKRQRQADQYETPYQQRNGLDIPPGVGELLDDPTVPLWVTEGSKKADCGAQYQLCIIALIGVWNWRGTNDMGGKTAVGDWNDVALDGRRVILAFDGDVARKPSPAKALWALADFLKCRGARIPIPALA